MGASGDPSALQRRRDDTSLIRRLRSEDMGQGRVIREPKTFRFGKGQGKERQMVARDLLTGSPARDFVFYSVEARRCARAVISAGNAAARESGHAEQETGQRLAGCSSELALRPKVTAGVAEIG